MAKYDRYVLPAPIMRLEHPPGKLAPGYNFLSVFAHKGELNADFTLGFHYMNEPYQENYPHVHQGHEILCFVGGNPENIKDFDAEIEIKLGEEGEIHIITTPTVLSLPPGLVHGPLTFKRVTKPVFFIEVTSIPKGMYEISPEGKYGKQKQSSLVYQPKRIGLVQFVYPASEFRNCIIQLAERLSGSPTKALSMMKKLVNDVLATDIVTANRAEKHIDNDILMPSHAEDIIAGRASFVESRPAKFN